MQNRYILSIFVFLFLFGNSPLFPQAESVKKLKENLMRSREMLGQQNQQSLQDRQLFNAAQSYISMNRYGNAIPILEDLCRRNPGNKVYYDWLLRSYLTLARIQSADSLVNHMMNRDPQNPDYQIDQGNVLYQQDKKDEALEIWKQVLRKFPGNISIYNQVANAMLQNRLVDEAISVYEQAIQKSPQAFYLYQNIAGIYQSRLMYAEAARYFLKYLEQQPNQRQYIFNRILSFQIEPDQRAEFFKSLEAMARKSDQSANIYLLMAQLYQRYGEFEKAYPIYLRLEDGKNKDRLLFQFANAAEQDSSYRIALQAYQRIIEKYPQSNEIMGAYSGAVASLYNLARKTNNTEFASRALQLIQTVQDKFPNHPELPGMSYLQGTLYLDYYFDVDKATAIFSAMSQQKGISPQFTDMALLKLGECCVLKGDLEQALQTFQRVSPSSRKGLALLQTARTYYFMKNYSKAEETINSIIQKEGAHGDATNDALALQMKISQAKKTPEVLDRLSEADLLIYQRKKSEAVKKLGEIVSVNSVSPLIKSDTYLRMEQLSLDLKEIPQALDFSARAIQDSALVKYADQHMFLMATVLENQLNKPQEAFKIYQQLLENYPNSLVADQARERMKFIRDQKPSEIP
ncbi:MAG: tetratricopeptide repeat protein [Calditrichia bacterium]